MNEFATLLIWTAARVTVVVLVAMAAYAFVVKNGPRPTVGIVTLALAAIIGLTGFSLVPWPEGWAVSWSVYVPMAAEPAPKADGTEFGKHLTQSAANASEVASAIDGFYRQFASGLHQLRQLRPERQQRWPGTLVAVFLVGVLLGLAHMAFGVYAVSVLRRRSRIVADADAMRLVKALATAMRIRRRVEIRESSELTSAATVGWRRPVILLPLDWRAWSYAELHAVLAHELAHIGHGDYLATLFARTAVALHFYQPLVHWLAARQRLQQELAADAVGAQFAGGRRRYLQALARLALRQDAPVLSWPARAFLPAPGTLMRRIHMLRMTQFRNGKPNHWLAQMGPAGLLLGAALGVTFLGGPAIGAKPRPAEERPIANAKLPAFDLSYVPSDALGVMALRPAVAFQLPGLKPYSTLVNEMISESGKQIGLKGELRISITDVEQIVGIQRLLHNPDAPEGQRRSVVAELGMIRTIHPFDWKEQIEAAGASLTEIPFEGGAYYKVSMRFLPPIMVPRGPFLYMPDDRTLVINTEENIKAFMRTKTPSLPACVWAEGWKRVEHDLFAVAFDTRDERITGIIDKEKTDDEIDKLWLGLLMKNAKQIVFGAGNGEAIQLKAFGRCESDASARTSVGLTAALIEKGREQLGKANPTNDNGKKMIAILAEMLENVKVERHGPEVHWSTMSKMRLGELIANSVSAELGVEK